jgi:putative ABC transport system permease protein
MEKLFNFQDFKYSIRDLTRSYKKISTIIFTLFISLFVLSIIISLEYSLKKELNSNAKILLGGDLEINTRNEKVNDEYLDQLKKLGDVSSTVEFSTMLADSKKQNAKTFFIRLKAVDDKYPLYGNVESFPKDALNLLQKTTNSIVVNKKIFETLNLKINDTVYIKQSPFKVVGYVETVPDLGRALLFGDFAVVSTNSFLKLNINTLGSFINYEYRLKAYNESLNIKDQVINLTKKYPSYSVRFPENSSNNLKKLIDNFSQFLSLVSISAMLIAGIGISNTLISFINQKNISIAIMKSLGFTSGTIKKIFYFEIFTVLFAISIIAYLLAVLSVPVVNIFLSKTLGIAVHSEFVLKNFLKVFLSGFLVVVIFCLPTISAIQQIKPSSLFRNVFQACDFYFNKKNISLIILSIVGLILLFALDSQKPLYTVGYFFIFFLICFTLYVLSRIIIFYLRKIKFIDFLPLRLAVKNITNPKTIFPITVLSLGLGVTLLLSLTLVGYNFKKEVEKSIPEIAPDYFFVSIQDTEKDKFVKYLKNNDPNTLIDMMPIVSASVTKINKKDPLTYIKSTNDSYWVLERDRRISWSDMPPKDNPITEGKWFDNNSKEMQISLDAKVAKDLDIKLNDSMSLKIYGRDVEGKVVNFRKVDYRDLSINFVILINPKFAINIPHEYIATAKFSSAINFKEGTFLQNFKNISAIKVSNYLGKITEIVNKIFIAVTVISSVAVIIGLMVISSAVIVQARLGIYQNLIFKILGINTNNLISASVIEFLITFFSIVFIALLFSIGVSYFVIESIFRLSWSLEIINSVIILLLIGILTIALILFNNYRFLSPKVYPLVRNE